MLWVVVVRMFGLELEARGRQEAEVEQFLATKLELMQKNLSRRRRKHKLLIRCRPPICLHSLKETITTSRMLSTGVGASIV